MRRDDANTVARYSQWLACATLLAALWTLPGTVGAAFYKCVGADGGTTYNDAPCAADEKTLLLSKSARQISSLDCRIARNFAFDTVGRMRQDDSAIDVFEAYGGAENLSEGVRNLINQVYTHQNDFLISAQRIVDLTVKRCQAGLLSDSLDQCEAFPPAFIERSGGCIQARHTEQTLLISPDDASSQSSTGSTVNDNRTTPALKAASPVTGESPSVDDSDDVLPESDDSTSTGRRTNEQPRGPR